ncbi:heavy metal translocating P-type ATPase [Phenylobacterium sp.]|jgi:Cd2+/Zn2+-exporting ATPase|uniref:heavy metal translocating P-type ATPase n=1 Tax=Phenylobacterium sp. TaxID=1871053 RepID=UPI000C974561|nr:heavy metal translocating P-type ATPase [Phenylobacterium sp.]MAK81846.1 heavy metal translocating P-type ATPase [Phenylobacterium sp.]MCA6240033.1 heavy metal translocating P-type ATPase [Phenylobacterium sp.]|tara:strand:+ start:55240 stop:57777 length:2538 start_codon:yes stop_codon:yes gene_type:complete
MAEEKLRLAIPVLLPSDGDACERCVQELTEILKGRTGVAEAHVEGREDAHLCIHFDPSLITPSQVRALAKQQGARIAESFGHMNYRLAQPMHARAARTLAEDLRAKPGVVRAEVGSTGAAIVEFDRNQLDEQTLRAFLDSRAVALGQAPGAEAPSSFVEPSNDDHAAHGHRPGEGHGHKHGGVFGERTELVFAVLSGVALLVGWLASFRLSGPVPLGFYVLAYGFGGYFTLREALENLRNRRFEIDTLMLVAAAGAAALGEWAEGALLLVLFSLGHALEQYAMGRARRAIEALAELAPERASRKRGDVFEEVPVEALQVGDIVLVRPNERLAADGVVVLGESAVNQAPVTGESMPVEKRPSTSETPFETADAAHKVFAGTINGAGALEVRVARLSSQSTLARVVTMVAEAEAQRSPTQRFTDKFERIFVPAVLAGVVALMFAWVVVDEPFSVSFYRAMAVLVAASPCALAISVPSAVLSGVARAGRGGVLVKGGGPLENLGTLQALAFDKTGTLTEGRPRVTDVVPPIGVTKERLLETAAAVEALSDHPLASAVVTAASEALSAPPGRAEEVESITGHGVRGRYRGEDVHIGKLNMFETVGGPPVPDEVRGEAERLAASGRTVMVVRSGETYLGVLGLQDTPREGAAEVIASLRQLGVKRMIMLSGDNQGVADAIAAKLGLTEAKGGLMPEDKVAFIKTMREQRGGVAMIGDGVNDAPAMANATVGIAMGAAGSDVALETADVALMADDLRRLPFAVGLSRQTSAIIKQNLFVSLGMVAFLIPATIFGLKIGVAVIFHEGSTLLVVANALRLLAFAEKPLRARIVQTPRRGSKRAMLPDSQPPDL